MEKKPVPTPGTGFFLLAAGRAEWQAGAMTDPLPPPTVTRHDPPAWLVEGPAARLCTGLAAARPGLDEATVVRAIGGCVRDWLLERDAQDIDLASLLEPAEAMAVLKAEGFTVVPTGIDHGTITAVLDGLSIELTTLRADVSTDGRRATVRFSTDWAEDAARRDFTMNALSLARDGRLFDYTGGAADARAGRLRFIGNAADRIAEDGLRLLRYFRFLARYGAEPIDRSTADAEALAAAQRMAPALSRLSAERIGWELRKWLEAPRAAAAWALMLDCGVEPVALTSDPAALQNLIGREAALNLPADWLRRLAALYAGPDAVRRGAVLEAALRLSRKEMERLLPLLDSGAALPATDTAALRQAAYDLGAETVLGRLLLHGADGAAAAALPVLLGWQRPRLPVAGADAIAAGATPGPQLGRLLAGVEAWWRTQDFRPDRAACLAELQRQAEIPS